MNYLQLLNLAAPEALIVLTALGVLGVDLMALRDMEARLRFKVCGLVACGGCVAAIAWMLALPTQADFLGGMLVIKPLTQLVKCCLLALTVFTVLISIGTRFTDHAGEYLALILMGAVGMMLLVSSEDILVIFLALELTSVSLYILTAFDKRSSQSAEAALKYFLFGSMSAAITLFGLSLLYGLSGSTNLRAIAAAAAAKPDPLLLLALVMVIAGFGFKVAAAPFHLWAPDAYQGAPAPSAAFIASGSKVAGFFIFARVMVVGFAGTEGSAALPGWRPGWFSALALIAAVSMVFGNVTAIVQSSVRRLLAYSAIAHAGYMLLAFLACGNQGLAPLLFYAITYALTTLGAFGVVSVVQDQTGGDRLSDFAGLGRRAPVLSLCLLVFLLSLAGIPPLAGFIGKFYVFAAALGGEPELGLLWLVVLAIAMSAVSLYYYLLVLKQVFVVQSINQHRHSAAFSLVSLVPLLLLAVAVIILGCAPDLLLEPLSRAVTSIHP